MNYPVYANETARFAAEVYNMTMTYVAPSHNGAVYVPYLKFVSPALPWKGEEGHIQKVPLGRLPRDTRKRIMAIIEKTPVVHVGGQVSAPYPGAQHWQTANDQVHVAELPAADAREIAQLILDATERPLDWDFGYGYFSTDFVPFPGKGEARARAFADISNAFFVSDCAVTHLRVP